MHQLIVRCLARVRARLKPGRPSRNPGRHAAVCAAATRPAEPPQNVPLPRYRPQAGPLDEEAIAAIVRPYVIAGPRCTHSVEAVEGVTIR